MKKKYAHASFELILMIFIVIIIAGSSAAAEQIKRVFIVHSYEKDHICGQPQHDGAIRALEEEGWIDGKNMRLATYYMDTKKNNNTKELIAKQAKIVLSEIDNFKPDLVITLDDNAFRTVALPLSDKPVKIVFSGMNKQPEDYNKTHHFMKSRKEPGGNITGVYEKLHVREAVKVLSKMLDLKKIRVLTDLSPTGRAISRQVELELEPSGEKEPLPCLNDHRVIKSWEEYCNEINVINADPGIGAFYLGTLLLKDAAGKTYTAPEIINYAIAHAKKPAIGLNYAFIKLGLYGGATVDFFAMGHQVGKMSAAILKGTNPGSLPIQDAQRVALVFNLKRAETLGLEIPNDILLAADEVFRK